MLGTFVGHAAESSAVLSIFKSRCVECHGKGGKVKGKLNLLKVDSLEALTTDLERLETLIDVLETREMPPEPEPALAPAVREAMVGELRELLRARLAKDVGFAPTPIRRMNRLQYNNAVQLSLIHISEPTRPY